MEIIHTIVVGVLAFASIVAFGGMLYVMILVAIRRPRSYTSYAIASGGLFFLSCFAGGLILFLDQPRIPVLIVILIASFVFALIGYESIASSFRFADWVNSRIQEKHKRENDKS